MEHIKKECHAKILQIIKNLSHGHTCDKMSCTATCDKMKRVISHATLCKTKRDGGCRDCVRIMALCGYHAKLCRQNQGCDVPFCELLKFKQSKEQLTGEVANWKRLRARVEPLSAAVRPDVALRRPNVWPMEFDARPLEIPQMPVEPEAGPSNARHVPPAMEPQAGSSTAPHVPPTLETKAGPSAAPHVSAVDVEARPAISSHLQPGVEPDVLPVLEPKKSPSAAPHVSPTVEPEAGPSMVLPAVDLQARSVVAPYVPPVEESKAKPSVAPQFQPAQPVEPYMGITIGPIATPSRPPVAAVRPIAGPGARMESIQYFRLELRPLPVHVQFEGVDVIQRPVQPYAQASVVQVEHPRAGMMQQPHRRHPPPANWRRTVSAGHRQHQVRKLVNSITRYYPPGYQGLIDFGNRLENILFGRATSLSNYYHLIGEQMNRMPRELEDHRRLMIRARWNNEVPTAAVDSRQ